MMRFKTKYRAHICDCSSAHIPFFSATSRFLKRKLTSVMNRLTVIRSNQLLPRAIAALPWYTCAPPCGTKQNKRCGNS